MTTDGIVNCPCGGYLLLDKDDEWLTCQYCGRFRARIEIERCEMRPTDYSGDKYIEVSEANRKILNAAENTAEKLEKKILEDLKGFPAPVLRVIQWHFSEAKRLNYPEAQHFMID